MNALPGSGPDVRIVQLTVAAFHALAEGDLDAADAVSPVPLSPYLAGPECRGLWRMRAAQCERDPTSVAWVTGVIRDERLRLAVGAAGFHGPPGASGMVEIGYRVDPAHRRRGSGWRCGTASSGPASSGTTRTDWRPSTRCRPGDHHAG